MDLRSIRNVCLKSVTQMSHPSSSSSDNAPASAARILIVEDNADTRAIIRQSLIAVGYQVTEAENGCQAQVCCREHLPDAIVLDVMMPQMTGIEFVQWFRDEIRKPFVPVLMLTALGEVEHKVEGLRLGADDYLVKPFNYKELQARLHALLRIGVLTNDLYRRTEELQEAYARLSQMQAALIAKERELVAAQLAGATAHGLGQPVTALLLHCRLAAKSLAELDAQAGAGPQPAVEQLGKIFSSVQQECETIRDIMSRLKNVDTSKVADYVDGVKILDIEKK
jgi:DNA-binding response OmpR family regulator